MDFNRKWALFDAEAEVHEFGVGRIVKAHNDLRLLAEDLECKLEEAERQIDLLMEHLRVSRRSNHE